MRIGSLFSFSFLQVVVTALFFKTSWSTPQFIGLHRTAFLHDSCKPIPVLSNSSGVNYFGSCPESNFVSVLADCLPVDNSRPHLATNARVCSSITSNCLNSSSVTVGLIQDQCLGYVALHESSCFEHSVQSLSIYECDSTAVFRKPFL